ncbi:hypothetical protein NDU88_009857 [Pleurodeles waltl]|uniref:Uncharacterized protein n=1 Tax=Pleurodeles waltl TaxID=8319 RepID=A0AAV7RZH7_PLEWA|nr:hypothetical protein NDU88_009857 [Pleurodeles waltl]
MFPLTGILNCRLFTAPLQFVSAGRKLQFSVFPALPSLHGRFTYRAAASAAFFSRQKSKHISEPMVISSILDTDDNGTDSVSDAIVSDDDDSVFSPPTKKAKITAQDAN